MHEARANSTLPEGSILSRALPRALRTSRLLLKLILPISFFVGLLRWSGALAWIGERLAPAMALFHLPGEAAMALVAGFLAGIYALAAAAAVLPLTPAEMTVISAMALVAHNLIVECAVQDRAGTSWRWMLPVRLVGSVLVGLAVAWFIHFLHAFELPALGPRLTPASPQSATPEAGSLGRFLAGWAYSAVGLTLKLAAIVTAMMIATEWIRSRGILARLERGCRPALRLLGLSESVAYPWLTAQLLGVAFGAGLIIEEMRSRRGQSVREVRDLHTSIGISHSLLEDTIILVALGASVFWIIVPRLILAALAVRILRRLPMRPRRVSRLASR